MKKIVLIFGLLSGAVAAAMMFITLPFADRLGFERGLIIGYTTIILSLLFVFFGVRSYRENVGGGSITFGRALAVGILITLISCICYVVAWEILYFKFMPDFADKYAAHAIEKEKANGASPQKIQAITEEMKGLKKMLDNPLTNGAMAFIEPFPVGVIITFLSALILRKRRPSSNDVVEAVT